MEFLRRGAALRKRNFSIDEERIGARVEFTTEAGAEEGRKEGAMGEREDGRVCSMENTYLLRGPAGSISSSVALFGFLDDITLGDGNNARFDRAFVDE